MDIEPIEALRRALAVATNLQTQDENENAWTECYLLLADLDARDARFVAVAMAHLLTRALHYASDLVQAVEGEGIQVNGIPGGTNPENILAEVGRQVAAHELGEGV
ncbi:hypothetical protein EDD28_2405 [Salana multivorans]|uniref:Uncharacterized protein n=1 Tax=Salana multivorans TaxID=120377 RepID=A0A3N2DDJ4_9MICO|nr:hypothetical protein [Salana multivorans]ROR97797.1 hypothetical protein EDD28_2405 [Salana multivorans]